MLAYDIDHAIDIVAHAVDIWIVRRFAMAGGRMDAAMRAKVLRHVHARHFARLAALLGDVYAAETSDNVGRRSIRPASVNV